MNVGAAEKHLRAKDLYKSLCVHQLFEMQAKRRPQACAVVFKNDHVTYADLNRRANCLAWKLIELGVTTDEVVGICAERSIEAVIGMLAVLKSGAAWLPLDPRYPNERLSFILRDANVRFSLLDAQFADRFPRNGTKVIELNTADTSDETNPPNSVSPDNLAYVIYTSGSTGKPKGVEVPHRGIIQLLFGINYVDLDEHKTLLQISALTFDLSIFDIFGALLHGGRSVLYPGRFPVVSELGQLLREQKVTTALFPTSLFNAVVDEAPGILATLKQILVAGEPMSVSHVRRAWDYLPAVEVINAYGPTEATVFACAYRIPAKPSTVDTSIPIGLPIGSTKAYILDQTLGLLPPGIPGELYLAGPGVARGYRNHHELTAERFVPDPFGKDTVLFKTGDLARYRMDGNIDFLGRLDNQVKIRGFRVELGEIEETSRRHEDVRDAVALTNSSGTGESSLSVFVHRKPQSNLSAGEMLEFLRNSLPEFMMPRHCYILDRWPLTPNGKVDRQALTAIRSSTCKMAGESVLPRTPLEHQLAQIWAQLLNVKGIGIRDDFFDLGGTSLLAMRLMAQIENIFGKKLPAALLLGAPTIEEFAASLSVDKPDQRLAYGIPIQSSGEEAPFFCLGAGSLLRPLANLLGPSQPFFTVGLEPYSVERLTESESLEEIARHLVFAMREKQPEGPYFLGGWCQDGVFAYEVAQQLRRQRETVGLLVLFETENPSSSTQKRISRTGKHLQLRIKYLQGQVRRLEIKPALAYIRACIEELELFLKQTWWRISRNFSKLLSYPPRNLRQMLYLAAISYEPQPLECPTILFRAKEWSTGDPYLGWKGLFTGQYEIYEIPGDHAGIFSQPNVETLARQMRICLENARLPLRPGNLSQLIMFEKDKKVI